MRDENPERKGNGGERENERKEKEERWRKRGG